jgi:hypothetical protein
MRKHNHYFKDVSKLQEIDVYRVLSLFEVHDPCLQHALKKILCCGIRGMKNADKDIEEAIVSLKRWQEMKMEDSVELKIDVQGINLEDLREKLRQQAHFYPTLLYPETTGHP